MTPQVSIVIPSYQGASRLPVVLAALADQETPRSYEVLVVVDGSTDGSTKIAKGYEDRVDLTVMHRTNNLGRSATLNEGFAAARGEVLVRCDDDFVPRSDYVEQFARAVLRDHDCGVVGLCRNRYPDTVYARVYGRPVDARFRSEAYAASTTNRWRFWGGNCAVHRSMWDKVGPYDAVTYRTYGWEDVDWGYRLVQSGGRIELHEQLEVIHHVAATTAAARADRAAASGAAAQAFDAKFGTSSLSRGVGLWGVAVRTAARSATDDWTNRLDRVLAVLPNSAGQKFVDFALQVQFRRGYLNAVRTHHDV